MTRTMPLVGVTQRSLPANEFGEHRYALDARWFPFLERCGVVPVPLPNSAVLAARTTVGFGLDGLVLTGGDDLAAYGGPSPDRDRTELALLSWALRTGHPVLGVCRGMQLMVHAFGGQLARVDGHVATRHEVRVADGGPRTVNSYHRWAAYVAPAPLAPTARCGPVIEAVHHQRAPVEGIMWHPEREEPFAPDDVCAVRRLLRGEDR
ncbi:gamma-glutamyl-gamma-aminobutyrate hydrolase family protein [Streptomyces sp. NA02950]|uniref:gamma-glutamyl-gamma-aminobutyrate hydrolase family protein n=1 Tax=Streptomyces sp. NA02950 TaxID=2742137 RepID=UPI00158FCBA1|nr:gamma-glutamyl-gamma-aminobutyrate hydrolase family protein [Streptomyces sp. NA02950]QKV97193.1 gamma-glutamyl-gamma-aminobutyrate hydrolase family protein [Streptomyces sp. NA02950]